jgi:hypothetical protein
LWKPKRLVILPPSIPDSCKASANIFHTVLDNDKILRDCEEGNTEGELALEYEAVIEEALRVALDASESSLWLRLRLFAILKYEEKVRLDGDLDGNDFQDIKIQDFHFSALIFCFSSTKLLLK